MAQYKLIYFNNRAVAEATRYLFALGDVDYEDIRVTWDDWVDLKKKMPFGHLPVLVVDGTQIAGSLAIGRFVAKRLGMAGANDVQEARTHSYALAIYDLINETFPVYRGKDEERKPEMRRKLKEETVPSILTIFEDILKSNSSGYLVGDNLTWADLELLSLLEWLRIPLTVELSDEDIAMYPKVCEHERRIRNSPKIAAWIDKRPKTVS